MNLIASLNTSFDSQIQSLEYIPNKVDLGEKKFIHNNKAFIIIYYVYLVK